MTQPGSALARAKERLTLSALWKLRGWPHEPAREGFAPYRPDDRRKSFSVFTNERGEELAKDFKSGDVYDAPGLLAAVEGLSNKDACRLFIELAGVQGESHELRASLAARRVIVHSEPVKPAREKPSLPALATPSDAEIEAIAALRSVSPESVRFVASLGLLFVSRWRGFPSWAITDSARWNCQFRRLDGKAYPHPAGAKKTLGVRGGWASWPLGVADLGEAESVLLVEGTGDFLAAWHFITAERLQGRCAAVTMTGAANWIPSEALALLASKRVRIFPHLDTSKAGEVAALRWETQLTNAGGSAHCFDLSGLATARGEPVTDLNDVLRMDAEAIPQLGSIATF